MGPVQYGTHWESWRSFTLQMCREGVERINEVAEAQKP
jgi:hypothetical protein